MTAEPLPRGSHLAAVPNTEQDQAKARAELTAAILHHKNQAELHTNAAKLAETALMQLHGKRGSTIDVGDNKVTWKAPGRSFDKAAFTKVYPIEANPGLYTTPDPVLDVSAIPPKLKDQFMKPGEGEGSIVIK